MIRRTFGALNPFSHQQVPTSERIGVGIRNGPTSHYDHVLLVLLSPILMGFILINGIQVIITL